MTQDRDAPVETPWEGRFITVRTQGRWEYVSRARGIRAAVMLTVDDGHVLLVEQYRVPIGRDCLELPAGLIGDETEGESGPGLVSLLEAWELVMTDSRLTQEALLDCGRDAGPCSLASLSAGGVWSVTRTRSSGREPGSLLVSRLMTRRWRPWLGRWGAARGVWDSGTVSGGAAEVWTAVTEGIRRRASRAGGSLFLFEGSRGASRPKDRPTADAPTTEAVAQSCVTAVRQHGKAVRLEQGGR